MQERFYAKGELSNVLAIDGFTKDCPYSGKDDYECGSWCILFDRPRIWPRDPSLVHIDICNNIRLIFKEFKGERYEAVVQRSKKKKK